MSLAWPMQLAWMAAAVIVVMVYLRWGWRKRCQTATLALWRQALARRSLWRRWRRPVSVLAACVPIALLALALAQPLLREDAATSRTFVLVIDATASMNATDVGPSRLAAAKRAARDLIDGLRSQEQLAVLSADSAVRVRCGLTSDRSAMHLALDEIQATDGAGAMPAAIAAAQRLLAGRAGGVLVVFSDGRFEGAEALTGSSGVVLRRFGSPAANIAITRLAARALPGSGEAHEVLVEAANFGDAQTQAEVKLEFAGGAGASSSPVPAADGRSVTQTRRLHLPPGAAAQAVVPISIPSPGLLTAKLNADDVLAADNAAQLLAVPPSPWQVLLVSPEPASPITAALKSIPGLSWKRAASLGGDVPPQTILIFHRTAPEKLPPRPALVIAPQAASELWQLEGMVESPRVAVQADHPLTEGIDLTGVLLDRAAKLRFNDSHVQLLATSAAGDPVFARVPREVGDVLVLAAGPDDGDLALRGDFPRLIAGAISWLGKVDASRRADWTTRDLIALPARNSAQQIISPFGVKTISPAGQPLVASLDQAGVWQVALPSAAGGQPQVEAILPVNLLDRQESDARTQARSAGRIPAPPWPDPGPLWSWLTALGLVWVVGLWVLFQRGILE